MFLLYLFNFTGVVFIRISHFNCLLPLLLLISLSFCSSFLFSSPPAPPSSLLLGPVPHLLLLSRMLSLVLLWFCSFGLLRLSSSMVHGDVPLDDGAGTGHRVSSPYMSEGGESSRRHTRHSPHPSTVHLVRAVGFKKLVCTLQREAMPPTPCTSLPFCPSTP